MNEEYSEKNKEAFQNPLKRFCIYIKSLQIRWKFHKKGKNFAKPFCDSVGEFKTFWSLVYNLDVFDWTPSGFVFFDGITKGFAREDSGRR